MNLRITDRNLILTGYVEPNKPRVARQVAEHLGMPFVDVEARIEDRFGDNMSYIRSHYGERRLKSVEGDLMEEVMLHRHAVIRVNGSTLMHGEHIERLQQNGVIVCLVARLDAILQQMHLTMGARYHNPQEREAALGALRREWTVRGVPGIHEIDATYKDEATLIDDVIALWQEISIERA
ncbi:MAG: shikimate kinase [Aggregatilineales bacterium]